MSTEDSDELRFREKVTCMSAVAKSIGEEAFIELAVRLDDSVQGLNKNNSDLVVAVGDYMGRLAAATQATAEATQRAGVAEREREHYRNACYKTEFEVQEVLGKALDYPRFCDLPPINPDDPEDVESQSKNEHYFVGEHVAVTLADEISAKLADTTQRAEAAEREHEHTSDALDEAMLALKDLRAKLTAAERQLPCGHPVQALGKVNPDNHNEVEHCLWCGDIKDLGAVLENLGLVYCHVTGGAVSKPLTEASVVIALADDEITKLVEQEVGEATEELRKELAAAENEAKRLREGIQSISRQCAPGSVSFMSDDRTVLRIVQQMAAVLLAPGEGEESQGGK